MILPIKHTVDWELIHQINQKKINKENIRKNRSQVDHYHKVGDKFIPTKYTAYKFETPNTGPFIITQCFTNGMVNLQYGPKKIRYIICLVNQYKSDTNVEDNNP